MENPLVSILIPNYNKATFLKDTLDSVLAQTYSNWECIVVDDHSTDNSWDILDEYAKIDSRFKIYKRPEDRKPGGNAARNYAFELSKGNYINWLDSDDILLPNTIKEKVNVLLSNSNLDLVLGDIRKFKINPSYYEVIPNLNLSSTSVDPVIGISNGLYWIQTSLPLFERNFLNIFPYLFEENILIGQEAEFYTRIFLKKPKFQFEPNSLHLWRVCDSSKTKTLQKYPFDKRYQLNYRSIKLIFLHIKKERGVSPDEMVFFKNVFNDRLLFLPFNSFLFWDLLWFGTLNNLFKGRFQGIKIFCIKILKNLKII